MIQLIRKRNTFLLFFKRRNVFKDFQNINIEDLKEFKQLMLNNQLEDQSLYFNYFLNLFKFPKWLNNYAHSYKINKINSYRRIQATVPININTYIKIIDILIMQNRDIRLKFFAVLMATGRRPFEIMKLSSFYKKSDNYMHMKKIAKKRVNNDVNEVLFPVFYNSSIIIDTINEIRYQEQADKLTQEEISSNLNYSYNRLFRQMFNNIFNSNESMYFCRALYSKFSYLKFAPKNMEINLWITNVLGHEQDDIITAFHYNRYLIEENNNGYDQKLIQLIEKRILTYIKRKTTYSYITNETLVHFKNSDIALIDKNFYNTLVILEEIMKNNQNDKIEMVRGLNTTIRKIFKKKYGYNYNYSKLTENLNIIFNI